MKNLKNLGKALNKAEQKKINGGLVIIKDILCYPKNNPNDACENGYHYDQSKDMCCQN